MNDADMPAEAEEEDAEEGEAPARIGHSAADSATTEEPEADVIDDPAEIDYVDLEKVHNAGGFAEARLIRGILESAQIPSVVQDDIGGSTLGWELPSNLKGADILVPREYVAKARAVLRQNNIACGLDQTRLRELSGERLDRVVSGDPKAREELAKELAPEARDLRHAVLRALGAKGAGAMFALCAILKDTIPSEEDPLSLDVATLAGHGAFGPEGAREVVKALGTLAKEGDPAVRQRVAAALGRLRGAGAGAALVSMLEDGTAEVRDEALESLYGLSGGESFDFDPGLEAKSQAKALAAWKAWAEGNPEA